MFGHKRPFLGQHCYCACGTTTLKKILEKGAFSEAERGASATSTVTSQNCKSRVGTAQQQHFIECDKAWKFQGRNGWRLCGAVLVKKGSGRGAHTTCITRFELHTACWFWRRKPLAVPTHSWSWVGWPGESEGRWEGKSVRRSILGRLLQPPSMWSWEEELSAFATPRESLHNWSCGKSQQPFCHWDSLITSFLEWVVCHLD